MRVVLRPGLHVRVRISSVGVKHIRRTRRWLRSLLLLGLRLGLRLSLRLYLRLRSGDLNLGLLLRLGLGLSLRLGWLRLRCLNRDLARLLLRNRLGLCRYWTRLLLLLLRLNLLDVRRLLGNRSWSSGISLRLAGRSTVSCWRRAIRLRRVCAWLWRLLIAWVTIWSRGWRPSRVTMLGTCRICTSWSGIPCVAGLIINRRVPTKCIHTRVRPGIWRLPVSLVVTAYCR